MPDHLNTFLIQPVSRGNVVFTVTEISFFNWNGCNIYKFIFKFGKSILLNFILSLYRGSVISVQYDVIYIAK